MHKRKKILIYVTFIFFLITAWAAITVFQGGAFSSLFQVNWKGSEIARDGLSQSEKIWKTWVERFPVCQTNRVSEVLEALPALREMPWGQDVELSCLGRGRVVRFHVDQSVCLALIDVLKDRDLRFSLNEKMIDETVPPKDCIGSFALIYDANPFVEEGLEQANAIVRQWRELSPSCDVDEAETFLSSNKGGTTSSWGGRVDLGCIARKRVVSFQTWPPICGDFIDFLKTKEIEFLFNGKKSNSRIEGDACYGAVAIVYPATPYAELGIRQADSILREWRKLSPTCNTEETRQWVASHPSWRKSAWGGRLEVKCQRGSRAISFQVWAPVCESLASNLMKQGQFFLLNAMPLPSSEQTKDCAGVITIVHPIALSAE